VRQNSHTKVRRATLLLSEKQQKPGIHSMPGPQGLGKLPGMNAVLSGHDSHCTRQGSLKSRFFLGFIADSY
jgi:hypothetical protein